MSTATRLSAPNVFPAGRDVGKHLATSRVIKRYGAQMGAGCMVVEHLEGDTLAAGTAPQ
jgi:hypothetical protein